MKKINLIVLLLECVSIVSLCAMEKQTWIPGQQTCDLSPWVDKIMIDNIGDIKANICCDKVEENVYKFSASFKLDKERRQEYAEIKLYPSFIPGFHWAPHLTPTDSHVIDQHVFRTPALIMQNNDKSLILLPDTKNVYVNDGYRIYMDMDALSETMSIGLSKTEITTHVLYERQADTYFPKGEIILSFYLLVADKEEALHTNPFRKVLDFFWKKGGSNAFRQSDLTKDIFETYCQHTYKWAFDTWKEAVWQEFIVDGKTVGAPAFIVNVTQSPNYPGEVNEREFRSIWNQAWFSSLRSATGLYRYARRTGDKELVDKALMSKELALAAPRKEGLFYGVVATEMEQVKVKDTDYNRSKGWNTLFWGNSNRNPITWDVRKSPFHILDMSWTAYVMLEWYDELEKDDRLLDYVKPYAETLLNIQNEKGYFPAWIDVETLKPLSYLADSPESSMSAWFLLKLARITGDNRYKEAALKTLHIVQNEIVKEGRWEDFETYWSCCRYGTEDLIGKKVARNDMHKQCNFSMYWTAGAFMEAYEQTADISYLNKGQRVMDELLMTQASWQPAHIYVDAVGGFGVMNCDGEWNDARGSLFAELIMKYGQTLKSNEYMQRGLMALKTAFSMMYCPENPKSKALWEMTWPFFGPSDYGFMMENYGHTGATSPEGEGVGEFTIYDWGNGAAAEAYNRILDHWGEGIFSNYSFSSSSTER